MQRLLPPQAALRTRLLTDLERHDECLFAVAYLKNDGVEAIAEVVERRLESPSFSLRIVCCASDFITDPSALRRLLDMSRRRRGSLKLRWHKEEGFHAKAYGFKRSRRADPTVLIGSANLSGKALGADSGELGVAAIGTAMAPHAWTAMERFWDDAEDVTPSRLKTYEEAYTRYRSKARAANSEVNRWRERFRRRRSTAITRSASSSSIFIEHGSSMSTEKWEHMERVLQHAERTHDMEIAKGWYVYDVRKEVEALPIHTNIVHVHWNSDTDAKLGASQIRIVRFDGSIPVPDPNTGKTLWLVYFKAVRGTVVRWSASSHQRVSAILAKHGLTWRSLNNMSGYLRGRRRVILTLLKDLKRFSRE